MIVKVSLGDSPLGGLILKLGPTPARKLGCRKQHEPAKYVWELVVLALVLGKESLIWCLGPGVAWTEQRRHYLIFVWVALGWSGLSFNFVKCEDMLGLVSLWVCQGKGWQLWNRAGHFCHISLLMASVGANRQLFNSESYTVCSVFPCLSGYIKSSIKSKRHRDSLYIM